MKALRDAWNSLNMPGRAVLVVSVAVVLIAAMYFALDLSWIPGLLGAR